LSKEEPLTVGKLKQFFIDNKVSDDVMINVLNSDGESTANIEVWFENLDTRRFISLDGKKPFWKMRGEENLKKLSE
jgi:hypothetical protein